MPKKTIPQGQMTVTPLGVKTYIIYNAGNTATFLKTARPPYSRRFGSSSTITSQSGKDGRFRPVVHSKANYHANPLSTLQPYQYAANRRTNTTSTSDVWQTYLYGLAEDVHAAHYFRFTAGVDAVNLSLASVQWASLSATALQTMLPSFHSQNSLVNFLLELKDFKSVVKYMFNGISGKLKLLDALVGFKKGDKPFKNLSRMYLSYSFGWRPLFNDIVAFIQTVSGFEARYRELMQRAGSPQQSYWGTWIAGTAANETVYYTNGAGDGPNGGWVGTFIGKYRLKIVQEATKGIRYHATLRYRYAMPDELRSAGGKAKAFLDLLGVARNPAILWNAIPFSFIIDWIVNVSKYLERLRVDNIDFKTEILDFCHSARIERAVRCEMAGENFFYPTGTSLLPYKTVDMCVKTAYERKLGLPNYLTAIQSSGLNPREFSLAAALVGANRKR